LDIPTFQQQLNSSGKQKFKIYSPEDTAANIGQAKGYYNQNRECDGVKCNIYTVAYRNKIFVFNLYLPSADKYRQETDLILTSFKFN